MIFRAELYNPTQGEANAVQMEFPIKDYGKAYDALRHIGIGSATAQDCRIKSIEGDYPALEVLAGANANVDELDYLAKRLDSFWGSEAAQFEGAAVAKGIDSIDDFINLTFSCQTVTVVSDFSDLEAVGKAHFINKNGGGVAVSEMEGVDFKQEALDLLQSGKGVVTPCGLVFDNGMEMERLYKGGEFPPYLHEPPVAVLWVRHESTPDASPTCLYLPMQKECMERALERGGWTNDWTDMAIKFEAHTVPSELFRTIDAENENPAQLNEMAQAIASVIRGNKSKLCAAVEMAEPPDAYSLGNLARHIEQFKYIPDVSDAAEYGRWMIAESGYFEYDPNLEEFYDFEGYGEWRMSQENGEFLEGGGYVCYNGNVPLSQLMGGQDTPEQGMEMGGM